jgi:hypothetical protein
VSLQCVYFTLVHSTLSITVPYPFNSHPPIFQQLSIHILTDVIFYDIVDALSFSFPFPPSTSSIESFHYCKHVLHLSLYMVTPRDIPKGMWHRLLQRHLHTHVYCSTIHNSQVIETAKMPHYWWIDFKKRGIYAQWNCIQSQRRMKVFRLHVNGWTWRTLSEVLASFRKPKAEFFSHMWNVDLIHIQQYHEKQVTRRGGHIQEGEGKRRKLRRWIWLMYSLYKKEYRNFKPIETTIRD